MRKAVAVILAISAIIALSCSSAAAFCTMPVALKIVLLRADLNPTTGAPGNTYRVFLSQPAVSMVAWSGFVQNSSPVLNMLASAMAGGVPVKLTGDVAQCPLPKPNTFVELGNIVAVQMGNN
jgi:hypothetical protein